MRQKSDILEFRSKGKPPSTLRAFEHCILQAGPGRASALSHWTPSRAELFLSVFKKISLVLKEILFSF